MHTCLIKNRFKAYWLMGMGSSQEVSGLKSPAPWSSLNYVISTSFSVAFQVCYFCLLYSQTVQMWQQYDFWLPLSWRHLYSQKEQHFLIIYQLSLLPVPLNQSRDQGKDAQLGQGHMPIPGLGQKDIIQTQGLHGISLEWRRGWFRDDAGKINICLVALYISIYHVAVILKYIYVTFLLCLCFQ